MKIHQILINDTNKLPNNFPKYYNFCFKQIKKLYPNEEYHLYSGEELEQIIQDNFCDDVYISYKKLKPYACKADLARYCLLYLYGGLYIDLTLYFINTIPNLDSLEFFAFRDRQRVSMQCWAVQNCIMYSHKNSNITKNAIDLIVKHCKKEYYGIQPTDVSATTVLGMSIMNSLPNLKISTCGQQDFILKNDLNIETIKQLNKNGYNNMDTLEGYIMDDDDKLIAIRKPSFDGDIERLGFNGTNNFVKMWNEKQIYHKKFQFTDKKSIFLNYQ
jgi:mannosyltransferase OCH1-like enzyme